MAIPEGTGSNNPTGSDAEVEITPRMVRELQSRFDNFRSINIKDGGVVVEVSGSMDPEQAREISKLVGTDDITVNVVDRDPSGGNDDQVQGSPDGGDTAPKGGGTSSGGTSGGGTGGGGSPEPTEEGGQRQIPGDMELWKVKNRHYLVTKVPGKNTPLAWKVENRERLNQLFDDNPVPDREFTHAQFVKRSPIVAGLSTEIQNVDGDPWQVFMHKWRDEMELRPWMDDPTYMAVAAEAYFEGREPTRDEVSQTDWWNRSTADERAWMEETVQAGSAEIKRRKQDAARTVADALREAGMDNAPRHIVDFIATQRLTGKWSQTYTKQQVAKLTDPYAAGKLDRGLKAALADPKFGQAGDARAISQGEGAVRERVRAIFENRQVPIGTDSESEQARINRITKQVLNGERTFSDVRESVDWIATQEESGRPGGLDVTREGEDNVRSLATRWLGPEVGNLPENQIAEWAGRIRNNPDAEQEFIDHLRQQRLALLPAYENENLTYEDIISPVRNLATNVWGQPVTNETMLVDLANTADYTEMAKRLRSEGLKQGVTKVKQDMLSGLAGTALGNQITRSPI